MSRAFSIGLAPQAAAAWTKALHIAQELEDREFQREALWGLWVCQIGDGDYRHALATAQAYCSLAEAAQDLQMGNRLVGVPLHCLGDHAGARAHIEQGLDTPAPVTTSRGVRFRFGQPMAARVILAQMLWLQGFPHQALEAASRSAEESRDTVHAISLCDALAQALCPITLWVGDYAAAAASIELLVGCARQYALGPWSVLGQCWNAVLHIARGNRYAGVPLLAAGLESLREARFAFYRTRFMGALAESTAEIGDVSRGLLLIDAALERCGGKEELWCLPELLRLKGNILLLTDAGANRAAAEDYYRQSLDWAQRQGALSWELRAAVSLGRLQLQEGLSCEARETVEGVYSRFTEGFATGDLCAARVLVDGVAG
jgi:hypothetical protein